MDYEKRYKEVLEQAKFLKKYLSLEFIRLVDELFPELKESEDEKIKRTLINLVESNGTACYINKIHKDKIFAWLEKQGEQKSDYCHHEVDLSNCSEEYRKAYYDGWNNCNIQHSQCQSESNDVVKCLINGMKFYYGDSTEATWGTEKFSMKVKDILSWLEKQGEQKPSDKVEPKFKVGDWVVYKDGDTFSNGRKFAQITNIDEERYWCDNWFWVKKEDITFWTFKEAKDGDVLISSFDKPFIYNAYFDSVYVGAYCGLGLNDEFIITDDQPNYFYWTAKFTVRPATEKESELLFNNMKEAGYKWNSDKKELIKL